MDQDFKELPITVDTVHKFQGREKDAIIVTTVDNQITSFTNDENLLNVAVSRAKKKLRLVVSDDEANDNTNIGDLIRYIAYQKGEVREGRVYSVFDLYKTPVLAIEVDGSKIHRPGTIQHDIRDPMKNHILDTYGIRFLRLKTNESGEKDKITGCLKEMFGRN